METKTRILAADSNKDFCRQLTELIAQEGDMEIVGTASDGMETLALLSEEKPDILLLDLVLPKLDGLEVLRRLPETGVSSGGRIGSSPESAATGSPSFCARMRTESVFCGLV